MTSGNFNSSSIPSKIHEQLSVKSLFDKKLMSVTKYSRCFVSIMYNKFVAISKTGFSSSFYYLRAKYS